MVIWYTDKIENKELGYCLYLDLKHNKEYWYDYKVSELYLSYEAGCILYPIPFQEDYTLKVRL